MAGGRNYWYTEQLDRITTTGDTSEQTILTLTVPAVSGRSYLAFVTGLVDGSATTQQIFRVRRGGTTQAIAHQPAYPSNNTNEPNPVCMVGGYTAASSGDASWTFTWTNSNSATTAGLRAVTFLVLELTSQDALAGWSDTVSTTSTTWQTRGTLSWTPASAGDYLILAGIGAVYGNTGNPDGAFRLYDGSNAYDVLGDRLLSRSASIHRPAALLMTRASLSASAQSWQVQYRSVDGSDTIYAGPGALAALRLDEFPGVSHAQSLGTTQITSTTMTEKVALTVPNKPSAKALILARHQGKPSPDTTNRQGYSEFRRDDAALPIRAGLEGQTSWASVGQCVIAPLAGETYKILAAASSGSQYDIREAHLWALQLDAVSGRGVRIAHAMT